MKAAEGEGRHGPSGEIGDTDPVIVAVRDVEAPRCRRDDRMGDLVAPDRVAKGDCFTLVGELRGMDPDDRQGPGEPGFQRLQLREDVQAVDSAVRPEVEEDHASPEIREAERMWGV